jgi:hypothetical protein
MVNWSREGGSVFLIMFKTRHALPLPGGRFSCPRIVRGVGAERLRNIYCSWPQTRPIRRLEQPMRRAHQRIIRARERSVSAISSSQQTCSQAARIRDDATVATVLESGATMAIKCLPAVRSRDLSTPANPPRIRVGHKLQLASNCSRPHSVSPKSWPAGFPDRIQAIPYYEHV